MVAGIGLLISVCRCSAGPLPHDRPIAQALGEAPKCTQIMRRIYPRCDPERTLPQAATGPGRSIVLWFDKRDAVEA